MSRWSDPFHSDRRLRPLGGHDHEKIWMAAIDSTRPRSDPSHPAFYIPGRSSRGSTPGPSSRWSPACPTGDVQHGSGLLTGFCRDGYALLPR